MPRSFFYTVIDAKGDVSICCHHVGKDNAKIGSLMTQSWQEILDSSKRKRVIENFPNKACIPLCRLHAHNVALQQILNDGQIPVEKVSVEVNKHAMFL
ncbi:SPASM domain-containing protein [Patescibacteria group bacterium]